MKIKIYKELIFLIFLSLIFNFSTINTVPVLDRDEARYAQATKQMIETGNYSSIKFQEQLRSKKPTGIYWLQSVSVNIFSADNRDKSLNKIWKYRFVSSLFSLISSIALFLIGLKIFKKKSAFLGAITLQCTLLFIIESHIAKTDAVLLTFSIISMILLCGYYNGILKKKYDFYFIIFWSSLGLSVLIKGPILLLIVLITTFFIILIKKQWQWVLKTNPLIGIIIVSLIIIPWILSTPDSEQFNFINEGLKKDFFAKLVSVQEQHGAFFGAHSVAILILFFPMSIFLLPSITLAIKSIKFNNNFFLIAWIVPNLIVLELIPTKLPHYTLPIYPALSLLVGDFIVNKGNLTLGNFKISKILNNLFYFILILLISSAVFICFKNYSSFFSFGLYITILIFSVFFSSILLSFYFNISKIFYYQILVAGFTSIMIFCYVLPRFDKLWISHNIGNIILNDNPSFNSDNIATIGFNEPSLIFTLGTKTKVLNNLSENFLKKKTYRYIIVEKKYLLEFNRIIKNNNYDYYILDEVSGFNMAKGKWVSNLIFKLK